MRILLVTHRFGPQYQAGTELYTAALARGFAERGHAVRIFTGDPQAPEFAATAWKGLPVEIAPWGFGAGPAAVRTFLAGFVNPTVERHFAQLCAAFRPEVAHVQHLMGLSPRLPQIAAQHGARVLLTLHDFWAVCANTWLYRFDNQLCAGPGRGYHCGACALQRLGRGPIPLLQMLAAPLFAARTLWLRQALTQADLLLVPSQTSQRILSQLGLPADQMRVVPSITSPEVSPRPIHTAGPVLRLLYLGSLIPPKGAHIAIAAVKALPADRVQLDVCGDPSGDADYAAQLRAQAASPNIRLHPPVPHAQVPALLSQADLLLLPGLWHEAYSIIVDEAFAAGLPVLVADHGAAAERVIAGVNGLTAPPGDVPAWRAQLQSVLDDPNLLPRLRAGVRPPSTLPTHLDCLETLYRGSI
jgi:glycosyltransferase involved in cell wall biosynthesis